MKYYDEGIDWHNTNAKVAKGIFEYTQKILNDYKKSLTEQVNESINEVSKEFINE